MNRVILTGRICNDVELHQTQNGIYLCRFRVAVNRPYSKDKEEKADFISCTAWRNTAEFVSKYFTKGSAIIVEGSLHNSDYTDQNGVKHYGMDVQVSNVEFGESKKSSNGGQQTQQYNAPPQQNYQQGGAYAQPQQNTHYAPPQQNYNQQYQQNTAQGFVQNAQAASIPAQQANLGDLSDYEEIISDGQVPF